VRIERRDTEVYAPTALRAAVRPAGENCTRLLPTRLLLSVIVPVYNQADSIGTNLQTIHDRIAAGLGEPFELVVVSDGSIDRTEEGLLESRIGSLRVISYDRNLGKGYAIKVGALSARGRWIAYVDSDLDLDPAAIPRFLETAQREQLDFAIGSKRHPDSQVDYPRSRRIASGLYQGLVRGLFSLDVRDTQVGLKVFRREIADQVMPLLLVKRFAFDLELLAVSRALGFRRIRELPIALDYRFTGSGVGSVAVLRALIDTAAIFYRLRILRYYGRKRAILGGDRFQRSLDYQPLVSLITSETGMAERLDYPDVEIIRVARDTPSARGEAARSARGEVLAFLAEGGRPAGNWISSALPFLSRSDIAAVVAPVVAPHHGSSLEQAAAAVGESRLGGGSLHFRSTPGNLRFVRNFPALNIVVRRADLLEAVGEGVVAEDVCERLAARGKLTLYTPETVVVTSKSPLFRAHLETVAVYAGLRVESIRRDGWRSVRASTVGLLALTPTLAAGAVAIAAGGRARRLGALPWLGYGAAVGVASAGAALRFRSPRVGVLTAGGVVATHAIYTAAFVSRLARPG